MVRSARMLAAAVALAGAGVPSAAHATFFSLPRMLKTHLERIAFEDPVLAPMAHTRFCLHYPADCQVRRSFRPRRIALTSELWGQLVAVNRDVNRGIAPERNPGGVATEEWLLSPRAGDCNDYAVTKRHELLALGWPSRDLILSEVVTPAGEHHLILVVRAREGDFVLDNLTYD